MARWMVSSMARLVVGSLVVATMLVGPPGSGAEAHGASYGLSDPSALRVHAGSMTVTEDGAVIENLEIRGSLYIEASDVVVRNVWVYSPGFWTVYVRSGSARFENVEIGHPSYVGERGIGGSNVTGRWLDIHHVEDGIKLGSNTLYEHVWVHDLASPNGDPHADAIQADGGQWNATVRHAVLDVATGPLGPRANAALQLGADMGTLGNITIEDSYLNGGNYTVFVDPGKTGVAPTNIRFIDNQFGYDHKYGPWALYGDATVHATDNIYPNGRPANPGSRPTEFAREDSEATEFAREVALLFEAGVTRGCGDGRFCPHETVTRGEMASFLVRSLRYLGVELGASGVDWFRDDDGSVHEGSIDLLAGMGIARGYSDGSFGPGDPVTRAQAASFMVRAFGFPPSSVDWFSDDGGSVHEADINALAAAGITVGCGNGRYCPDRPLPRDEVAVFLVRVLGL